MPYVEHDSACILPSALHMIKASTHYVFQVRVMRGGGKDPLILPCQKIVALVKSTTDSITTSLGPGGFKIVTRNIECMLADCEDEIASTQTTEFVLSSTCPVENVTSYKLNPPRGKAQHALVTITGKLDEAFIVDQVQHLTPDEATDAKESLWKTLLVACMASSKDYKRDAPWTEVENPANAKRCKVLGRAPTDAVLPNKLAVVLHSATTLA